MKEFLLLLLFPNALFAQKIELEKTDTLLLGASKYPTYMLRIDNNSASDPAKVFVSTLKYLKMLKRLIPKYYFTRKQEYNEYYLLGVPNFSQKKAVEKALTAYLNKIDSSRMLRKRSTFLRLYTWDNAKNEMNYQRTFKDLSKLDNVFYLKNLQDLCNYMVCPTSRQFAD